MLHLFLLCLVLALPAPAASQPAAGGETLTLDDAIRLAVGQNRHLRNASLELARAEDRLEVARTRRLPALLFGMNGAYVPTPLDLRFDQGAFGTFAGIGPVPPQDTTLSTGPGFAAGLNARVVQPLSQLYRIGFAIDALETGRAISREELRARRQAVVADVRRVYYSVLQADSALAAAEQQLASYAELDRLVERRLAEGTLLLADRLEVKARLARARHQVLGLRNQSTSRKERLNTLLGRDVATPFQVSPVPDGIGPEADRALAEARALEQRPEVRRARLQIAQAEADLRVKRAELIPDLSFVAAYVAPITSDVLPQQIATIGLELTWDVFDWGRKRREAAEKAKAAEQLRNLVDEATAQVLLDVRNQARQLEEARELVAVAALGSDAARERLRVTTNRYAEEAATLRDLLEAQAALGQADDQHQQALLALWTARAELERALGDD
jgi:outer membrane protein TolC